MSRLRIPLIVALGAGILLTGLDALASRSPSPRAAFSRDVDDQRGAVAKPEVRDAEEERSEEEGGTGLTQCPAIDSSITPHAVVASTFLGACAVQLDAGCSHGSARCIRGPPQLG